MGKYKQLLKNSWWVFLALIILLILVLIPTRSGLPSRDYKGCEVKNSTCQYSIIKSITKESDGSATLIVPVKFDENDTQDLSFHLIRFSEDWVSDGRVMMTFLSDKEQIYLFIESKSNMLQTIIDELVNSFQGPIILDSSGQQITKQ